MNESKEGFACFVADASRGRKIGAVLSWVAAIILLAALFTPMFKVGVEDAADSGKVVSLLVDGLSEDDKLSSLDTANKIVSADVSEEGKEALDVLYAHEEHNVSLLNYLIKYDKLLNSDGSSVFSIIMLVLYAALIIGTIIMALFTMLPLSTVCTIGAVLQMFLLYFFKVKTFINPSDLEDFPISLSIVCIILMVAAVVFALAGLIVGIVVKDKNEAEDEWPTSDDPESENRSEPTALFGSITIVQLNTSKRFKIQANEEKVIGRSNNADIVIANPAIGRMHAKIMMQNGDYVIVDLNSRNGTYVGDNKLPGGGSTVLHNGDYVTLGNEMFEVEIAQGGYYGYDDDNVTAPI